MNHQSFSHLTLLVRIPFLFQKRQSIRYGESGKKSDEQKYQQSQGNVSFCEEEPDVEREIRTVNDTTVGKRSHTEE